MASVSDVSLDHAARTVSWRLSVSKTDPAALGCERRWGCLCGDSPGLGCPYHAAAAQVELLCALFGERVEEGDLPFFPDSSGFMVRDSAMEAFVDALAAMAGCKLTLPSGARKFGKHSFRSTGAVLLSKLGIELFKIQLLARWASPVVLHYAREAPLETLTTQVKSSIAGDTVKELVDKLRKEVDGLKAELAKLDNNTAYLLKMEAEVARLTDAQDEAAIDETAAKEFECVVNPVTKKCHRVLIKSGVPKFWRARCSWDFGLTHHEFREGPVDGYKDLCDTCFHELRVARKAGASSN